MQPTLFALIFFFLISVSTSSGQVTTGRIDTMQEKQKVRLQFNTLYSSDNLYQTPYQSYQNYLKSDLHLTAPVDPLLNRVYDPKNVIPDNPLELDYRHHSYYTPKMVSDHLMHAMNRPRADSFVPILPLAFIAVKVAMQYINIEEKLVLRAKDYLLAEFGWDVLQALWQSAPLTVKEIFAFPKISHRFSMVQLNQKLLQLTDKRLVKRRLVDGGETLYFPAQTGREAKVMLKRALDDEPLDFIERKKILELIGTLN